MMVEKIKQHEHPWAEYERVIVFDGVCNFCHASVQFVMKRDADRSFRFATLQSQSAQQLLRAHGMDTENFNTFLYVENNQVYTKSTAALKVCRGLSGWVRILSVFLAIPSRWRDPFYEFIAVRRFRWMGRRETCVVPAAEEIDRFV